MAMRKLKPYSPGTRHATVPDFAEITKSTPEKSLTVALRKNGGRNNAGRITVRHRGGGHRRRYRIIDFKRRTYGQEGVIKGIEYDPNRNCRIALVQWEDGSKAYILAAKGLTDGAKVSDYQTSGEPAVGVLCRCATCHRACQCTTLKCMLVRVVKLLVQLAHQSV